MAELKCGEQRFEPGLVCLNFEISALLDISQYLKDNGDLKILSKLKDYFVWQLDKS